MANFQLAPGEELVQCPYEKSHQIINNRFSIHLTKCRDNYLKDCVRRGIKPDMGICRYNRNHQGHKTLMKMHEDSCPDRYSVVPTIQYHQSDEFKFKLAAERGPSSSSPVPSSSNGISELNSQMNKMALTPETPDPYDGGENWDADARNDYQPGYDPKKKLADGVFLAMPSGLKPAERKAYRLENIRKAREQEEREEIEKYGPRTGSAEQPHWRQDRVSPTVAPGGSSRTGKGAHSTAPAPLPIGLTLADVINAQGGPVKGKKKNKKKKGQNLQNQAQCPQKEMATLELDTPPPSPPESQANAPVLKKTESPQKPALAEVAKDEEEFNYDWTD